jgi:hypothetical protein
MLNAELVNGGCAAWSMIFRTFEMNESHGKYGPGSVRFHGWTCPCATMPETFS